MFNDCSVFSLGHRSVDADFKPHFSCNYCGMMHISMSVILGQSIAVGCFFFKEKIWPEKNIFKDLQIPNIKYVNTLCL